MEEITLSPASAWRCHTSLPLIAYWGGQDLPRRKDADSIMYLGGRAIKTPIWVTASLSLPQSPYQAEQHVYQSVQVRPPSKTSPLLCWPEKIHLV